jgi:quercetin dioxygenase-like cupin family protein
VHELGPDALAAMEVIDLATVNEEPASPIGTFEFHDCTTGVASFKGRPPWELHTEGDELLHILSGECELTVLEPAGPVSRVLRRGDLAVIPQGRWHCNDAANEVRMLFITPTVGNDHSRDDPRNR